MFLSRSFLSHAWLTCFAQRADSAPIQNPFASRDRDAPRSVSYLASAIPFTFEGRAQPRLWRGMSRCAARCLHLRPVTGMMDVSILPMVAAVAAMITVNIMCTRNGLRNIQSISLPLPLPFPPFLLIFP